jgi:hypothetical protein
VFYQTHLRGREPDYALFDSDRALDAAIRAGRVEPAFWQHPIVVADAKAWHINLDRPSRINNQREYPPEQIEWYLDRSRLSFGLLTNGRLWRLIPRELEDDQPRFQTYLECDLSALLEDWLGAADLVQKSLILNEVAIFILFFSPLGFRQPDGGTSLIDRAREGSNEYRLGVGEDLKTRVFDALRFCVDGFFQHPSNHLTDEQLPLCRSESFTLLYRLLFILYAEDRDLLPFRTNRLYADNRSLARIRQEIGETLNKVAAGTHHADYTKEGTRIWEDLQSLFDLIDNGHARYQVPQYNGGLFDDEEHPFLRDMVMGDWYLARTIDQLSRARDVQHPDRGFFAVDYRDLRIQHLGSIYEGLLELHPARAALPVRDLLNGEVVPAGHVFLRHEASERRNTGSYYTPNHIVDYIVENTLGPLCHRIDRELRSEIDEAEHLLAAAAGTDREADAEARLNKLLGEFDDRMLRLRIVDPAMGSGHFLLSACQYLAEEIATHPFSADSHAPDDNPDGSSLVYWKRQVVEHCLFGVDQNPLAVELAKLALWLDTVATDKPLTYLDHHLRVGNSLVGASVDSLDTLPGRPPLVAAAYRGQVTQIIESFLNPLDQIRSIGSDTADRVKQKSALLRQANDRIRPFAAVGDLWCASFYLSADQQLTDAQYASALNELAHPVRFSRLLEEPWFQKVGRVAHEPANAFFHWELQFPEVFFTARGQRSDAGFDAVIGNPPYDVVSELETGQRLEAFRHFVGAVEYYAPSIRGKNNLYKLFVCRALSLLAPEGYLGFITPMPLLGDDQAADVRREILRVGSFKSIDAFPQKDDVDRRVFREAKLSTVVFTMQKTPRPAAREERFTARVHPANVIVEESPALQLSTNEIPLYDPRNVTIASCDQQDWDLAVRIMRTGRLRRLGGVCSSYQGEVNETNERPRNALAYDVGEGDPILRGSNICLYKVRDASQGRTVYMNRDAFLAGKAKGSKAYAFRGERVGFQRSAPQNNFRRLVAAPIATGQFCFDTVSYIPATESSLAPSVLLALLNSKLLEWYFRLGSTNSKVNEYQFDNLPCPVFADEPLEGDSTVLRDVMELVERNDTEAAFNRMARALDGPAPFPKVVADILGALSDGIQRHEQQRGDITRRERARLAQPAQPIQELVDRVLFGLAGLTAAESARLEARLETML